ncbi:pol [Symbiodinium sp. CCMP2592]|nr:pol [Symbiodinium sp. CCMP2592]
MRLCQDAKYFRWSPVERAGAEVIRPKYNQNLGRECAQIICALGIKSVVYSSEDARSLRHSRIRLLRVFVNAGGEGVILRPVLHLCVHPCDFGHSLSFVNDLWLLMMEMQVEHDGRPERGSPTEIAESEDEFKPSGAMDLDDVKQEKRKRETRIDRGDRVRDGAAVPVGDSQEEDEDLDSPSKRPQHGDAPLSGQEIRALLLGHVSEMKEAWRSFQGRLDRVESEQLQQSHEMIHMRTRTAALEKTNTGLQKAQDLTARNLDSLSEDVKKMKVQIEDLQARPPAPAPADARPVGAPCDPWAEYTRRREQGDILDGKAPSSSVKAATSSANDRPGEALSEDEKRTLVFGGWARDTKRSIIEAESAAFLGTEGMKALTDVQKLMIYGPRRSVGMMKFTEREGETFRDVKNRMWEVIKIVANSKVELASTKDLGEPKTMWASFVKTKAARAKSTLISMTRRVACDLAMGAKNAEGGIKFIQHTLPSAFDCDWNMGTIWCGDHKLASATHRAPRDNETILMPGGWVDLDAISAITGHRWGRISLWNLAGQSVKMLDLAAEDADCIMVQEIARGKAGLLLLVASGSWLAFTELVARLISFLSGEWGVIPLRSNRSSLAFRDTDETKNAIIKAQRTRDKADWKHVHQLRRFARKAWQEQRLSRILAGGWDEFRSLQNEKKRQKGWWGELLQDRSSSDLTREVQAHLESKMVCGNMNTWDTELDELIAAVRADHAFLPFDLFDVRTELQSMRCRSAVGPDGIGVHLLREIASDAHLGEQFLELINHIVRTQETPANWNVSFLALLAKCPSPQRPKDLRPIAVSSAFNKLVNRLVCSRTFPKLRRGSKISACGRGRQAADLIGGVSRIRDVFHEWRVPGLLCKLDVAGAFDRVDRRKVAALLLDRLKNEGVPAELRYLLGQLRSHELRGNVPGGEVISFRPNQGIKQGAPESAEIFGLLVDSLLSELIECRAWKTMGGVAADFDVDLLFYQDDVFLVESDLGRLVRRIRTVDRCLHKAGLCLATDKTKIICTSDYHGPRQARVAGDLFSVAETLESVKVLGVNFNFHDPRGVGLLVLYTGTPLTYTLPIRSNSSSFVVPLDSRDYAVKIGSPGIRERSDSAVFGCAQIMFPGGVRKSCLYSIIFMATGLGEVNIVERLPATRRACRCEPYFGDARTGGVTNRLSVILSVSGTLVGSMRPTPSVKLLMLMDLAGSILLRLARKLPHPAYVSTMSVIALARLVLHRWLLVHGTVWDEQHDGAEGSSSSSSSHVAPLPAVRPSSFSYEQYVTHMALAWDEDVSLGLQLHDYAQMNTEEEDILGTAPLPADLPVPFVVDACVPSSAMDVAAPGTLAALPGPAVSPAALDPLAVALHDGRRLRGLAACSAPVSLQAATPGRLVFLVGVFEYIPELLVVFLSFDDFLFYVGNWKYVGAPCANLDTATGLWPASESGDPWGTTWHSDPPAVANDPDCRDRWHHPDGSIRNRRQERLQQESLQPIDENQMAFTIEASERRSDGHVVVGKTFYGDHFEVWASGLGAAHEESTSAGSTGGSEPSDTGGTSEMDGTPVAPSSMPPDDAVSDDPVSSSESSDNPPVVGFWRHGVFVPRARSAQELRDHQGGGGMQRWLRKQRRMHAYFAGQWKPAWLEKYIRDKQARESTAATTAQQDEMHGLDSEPSENVPPLASTSSTGGTSQTNEWAWTGAHTRCFGSVGVPAGLWLLYLLALRLNIVIFDLELFYLELDYLDNDLWHHVVILDLELFYLDFDYLDIDFRSEAFFFL